MNKNEGKINKLSKSDVYFACGKIEYLISLYDKDIIMSKTWICSIFNEILKNISELIQLHNLSNYFDIFWDDVQRANLTKRRALTASESKRGSLNDVIKPPGWVGPKTEEILKLININDKVTSFKEELSKLNIQATNISPFSHNVQFELIFDGDC